MCVCSFACSRACNCVLVCGNPDAPALPVLLLDEAAELRVEAAAVRQEEARARRELIKEKKLL